jgi:Uma2 family endonuclease
MVTLADNRFMAATLPFLSLQEFESRFGDRKPYHEYWFGEASEKSAPTLLHGIVQAILGYLLLRRGYVAASEVRVKLSNLAQPIPDLIANPNALEANYPKEPFEIAIEILSPSDSLKQTIAKAAHYLDWKVQYVWIIDPEQRIAYQMSLGDPEPRVTAELTAGPRLAPIPVGELWAEVDSRLQKQP